MEGFFSNIDFVQILLGFVPGFIVGFLVLQFTKPKARKSIAASADNDNKLEKEVLQDEVKHLQDKIVTLEKALEMKLK